MQNLKKFNEEVEFYASHGKISSKLSVFYNPIMRTNRDISVLFLLTYFNNPNALIIDAFAASGIRALRWLKQGFKNVVVNDKSKDAYNCIKENLKLNNLNAVVENLDYDHLVLKYRDFDYIDIDPFGSPNPFLDLTIKYAKNNSIIAITSTDTGALTGTHPRVTYRKYWSKITRLPQMHEFGLRILIRKIQLHGASYDKALIPLISYYKDHYFRIYFQVKISKSLTDELLKKHQCFRINKTIPEIVNFCDENTFGPLWCGELNNKVILQKMLKYVNNLSIGNETKKLLNLLYQELPVFGFIDTHAIGKELKMKSILKRDSLIDFFNQNDIKATRTHFSNYGIKVDATSKKVLELIEKFLRKELKKQQKQQKI